MPEESEGKSEKKKGKIAKEAKPEVRKVQAKPAVKRENPDFIRVGGKLRQVN